MASSWEKFEELIKEKMRTVYSDVVVELGMNPKNLGEVDDANGFARITGPCGDTMSIWLKIEGDSIVALAPLEDAFCAADFNVPARGKRGHGERGPCANSGKRTDPNRRDDPPP